MAQGIIAIGLIPEDSVSLAFPVEERSYLRNLL